MVLLCMKEKEKSLLPSGAIEPGMFIAPPSSTLATWSPSEVAHLAGSGAAATYA